MTTQKKDRFAQEAYNSQIALSGLQRTAMQQEEDLKSEIRILKTQHAREMAVAVAQNEDIEARSILKHEESLREIRSLKQEMNLEQDIAAQKKDVFAQEAYNSHLAFSNMKHSRDIEHEELSKALCQARESNTQLKEEN